MPKKKNYTKNECIDLFSKCKNRSEFRKKYSGAWKICVENKWENEIENNNKEEELSKEDLDWWNSL